MGGAGVNIWTVLLRIGRKRSGKYEVVQVYARDAEEAADVAIRCQWAGRRIHVVSAREETP